MEVQVCGWLQAMRLEAREGGEVAQKAWRHGESGVACAAEDGGKADTDSVRDGDPMSGISLPRMSIRAEKPGNHLGLQRLDHDRDIGHPDASSSPRQGADGAARGKAWGVASIHRRVPSSGEGAEDGDDVLELAGAGTDEGGVVVDG